MSSRVPACELILRLRKSCASSVSVTMTTRTTTSVRNGARGRKEKGAKNKQKGSVAMRSFEAECARSVLIKILTRSLFHSLSRVLQTTTPPKPSGRRSGRLSVPLLSSPRKFLVPRRFRESIMRSLRVVSCSFASRRVASRRRPLFHLEKERRRE